MNITESGIEQFAIEILQSLGWQHIHGLSLAPGAESAERENFEQIILIQRLRKVAAQVNGRESEGKVFGDMIFMIYFYNITNKQEVQNACS